MVKELNTGTFDEMIKTSELPVAVDFWAEWCGPCRMFGPIVEEAAEKHADKVMVCKLNVDESPDIAARYGVMSIPTMILFKDGEPAAQAVGVQSNEELEEFLEV